MGEIQTKERNFLDGTSEETLLKKDRFTWPFSCAFGPSPFPTSCPENKNDAGGRAFILQPPGNDQGDKSHMQRIAKQKARSSSGPLWPCGLPSPLEQSIHGLLLCLCGKETKRNSGGAKPGYLVSVTHGHMTYQLKHYYTGMYASRFEDGLHY